jgi:CheY-like chemotaxis protein
MADFPKLQNMLESALAQASSECGMLLGQELAVSDVTCGKITKSDYFGRLENAALIVGINSQDEYPGQFYLVFALRDAIVLSSMLLGVPPARIVEKKRLAIFEVDDEDAFSEIANQVIGSFNTVFKPHLPKKVHLKQLAPRKFIPDNDTVTEEEPFADGDYCLFAAQLSVPGQDMERVELLLPVQLATLFDLQDGTVNDVEEEPAVSDEATEDAPAAAEAPAAVLILDDNPEERERFREILAASGVRPLDAPLNADLGTMISREGVRAVLLGVEQANDNEFSLCARIGSHFPDVAAPIIICARQWTRTGVLKALKHGASDILLSPFEQEELTAKVSRLMNAC